MKAQKMYFQFAPFSRREGQEVQGLQEVCGQELTASNTIAGWWANA